MFARVAVFTTLVLAAFVAADDECNTGSLQCCDSLHSANSEAGSAILSTLGLDLQDTTAQIGLDCSPISIVGVGAGVACAAQPVCCENENVSGGVSLGCAPFHL